MVAQILIDFPDCLFCLNLDSPDLHDYHDFKKDFLIMGILKSSYG